MKKWISELGNQPFVIGMKKAYQSSDLSVTSIAVAYYFLISIFPLLLIVTNMLPYFQIQTDTFLETLQEVLPTSLYRPVLRLTDSILTRPSTGLLSFSLLSALWTFSQTMTCLQKAFNKVYGVDQGRGFVWSRLFSFLVSLGLQVMLGFSLVLAMFGRMFVRFLHTIWQFNDHLYHSLLNITQPLVYLLLFITLILLYFLLPNVRIRKVRYVLPGAGFVVLVLYSITNLFAVYIEQYMEHFLDVRFLGSVLVLVVMFWFILMSKVLIFGSILNAGYQATQDPSFQVRNGELKQFVKEELKR